jgi:hypothetical protein
VKEKGTGYYINGAEDTGDKGIEFLSQLSFSNIKLTRITTVSCRQHGKKEIHGIV